MAICQYLAIEFATILMRSTGKGHFEKKASASKTCEKSLPSNDSQKSKLLDSLYDYAALSCSGASVLASSVVTVFVLIFFAALSFNSQKSPIGWISIAEAAVILAWAFILAWKIHQGKMERHNQNHRMPARKLVPDTEPRARVRFIYNYFWASPRLVLHNLGSFSTVTFYKAWLLASVISLLYLRTLL
jgi:hypothetical protein